MPAQQDRLPTSIDHAFRTVIAEATKAAVGRSLTGVQGKLESAMEQVAQAETGLKGATAGARDAVKRGRSAIRKLRQLVGAVAFMWVLSKVVGLILTLHDVSRRVDAQTIVSVVSVLVPLAWYWLKTTDVRRVPRRRQWLRDQVCRRHRRRRSRWSGSWSPKLRVFFREHTSIRLVTKTSLISIVVTATSLISILIVYNVIPAHPPSPAAVLNCTTDGLPDLEVVCSTQFSRNSPRGYINFGDECQQQEVDLGDRLSSQANSRQATPVKGIYHKRYKRGGDYRVELKLEGEIANSTAGRTVTVKESATLPKGELDLTGLYWITDGSGATRSLRYRIRQDKFEYNSSNKHTWTIKADHGRKFTNCEFEATTASMNVRYDRDGLELTGDGGPRSLSPSQTIGCS